MEATDKIIINFFKTVATLNIQEKEKALKEIMKKNNWSLRRLSKEINVPLTTVHGWVNRRELERKKVIIDGEIQRPEKYGDSIPKGLKEIAIINSNLRTVLNILKDIKKIDNNIATGLFEKIVKEVERLK